MRWLWLGFLLGQLTLAAAQPKGLTVKPDLRRRTATLQVNGRVIHTAPVQPWLSTPNKGQVRQTFQNAVASGDPKEAVPIEYQYSFVQSPDGQYTLAYHYDYGQSELQVSGWLLNASQSVTASFVLPVEAGFTNHSLFIDNRGNVYLLHTDAEDGLHVIRYCPQNQESNLLTVGSSGSRRNRFIPFFGAAGAVYVAGVCESRDSELSGVLVATFDFKKEKVTDVQFYAVSAELRKQMSPKLPEGRYDLVGFEVKANGEKILELEKHAIAANNYQYDPFAVNDLTQWKPRKQQVRIGEKIRVRLDATGRPLEETASDHYKTF